MPLRPACLCPDANPGGQPRDERRRASRWHRVDALLHLRSSFGPRRKGAPEFQSRCSCFLLCPPKRDVLSDEFKVQSEEWILHSAFFILHLDGPQGWYRANVSSTSG